jgi:hypothetical protein
MSDALSLFYLLSLLVSYSLILIVPPSLFFMYCRTFLQGSWNSVECSAAFRSGILRHATFCVGN